ncbi:IS1096 element passenger TnpR family protein [Odoribacter lunatus]|uniref:IS1096 element passenger TnpR family protein n=1 Tax=Odoribacter lunatus TaxID=2941335 RepID=UPI00203D8660|nr:hypothetical protein [Odoribacter lunatus]
MNYRFEINFPDTEFRCEIAIAGEQTFQQFHDKIIEVLEYDGSQMASFYTLDKMGVRGKEIALTDMVGDEDTMMMNTTKIEDVVNADCIELEYVYDFFNNKYFKVEYAGEYKGKSDALPACLYCEGEIPEQMSFDPDEEWDFNKSDDDEYDDSFMEEFNDYSDEGGFEDDEDNFGDEDDFGGGGYGSSYDSIDDYIDKL